MNASARRPPGRWQLGLGLALLTTLLWGSLPIALKSLLDHLSPLTVTWYRYAISAVLLTAYLAARGGLPAMSRLRAHAPLLAVASLGFIGNNIFYLAGLNFVTPSAGQVVIQLAPVMLIGAGVFLFGEPFSRWQWLGVAVLLAGMLLFFYKSLAQVWSAGVLLIVMAATMWTAYAVAQKRLLADLPSLAIMCVAFLTGFVLVAPVASPGQVRGLDALGWVFLAYCSVNGLVGYGAFAEAMANWEVSRVSAVLATTPLFTPIFAECAARIWPGRIAHEGLDGLQLAGGAMVALGSIMTALSRRPISSAGRDLD